MRGVDWIILVVCALLIVSGPLMALQEFSRHRQAAGLYEITGTMPELDTAFRSGWRAIILAAIVVAGILGTLVAVRVARRPRVRAVSGRLLTLFLAGMTLLDVAFLIDGRWFVKGTYFPRVLIVWLYPLAAILIAGSLVRLAELEDAFPEPTP